MPTTTTPEPCPCEDLPDVIGMDLRAEELIRYFTDVIPDSQAIDKFVVFDGDAIWTLDGKAVQAPEYNPFLSPELPLKLIYKKYEFDNLPFPCPTYISEDNVINGIRVGYTNLTAAPLSSGLQPIVLFDKVFTVDLRSTLTRDVNPEIWHFDCVLTGNGSQTVASTSVQSIAGADDCPIGTYTLYLTAATEPPTSLNPAYNTSTTYVIENYDNSPNKSQGVLKAPFKASITR